MIYAVTLSRCTFHIAWYRTKTTNGKNSSSKISTNYMRKYRLCRLSGISLGQTYQIIYYNIK